MQVAKKRAVLSSILRYNHFFIKLSDGSDRHLLFTDGQIRKAKYTLISEDIKTTWIHEIWYDGLVSKSIKDIRESIKKHSLPRSALTISHIRAKVDNSVLHLFFNKCTIRNGVKRAAKFEKTLPKLSWISDKFKEKKQWESCQKVEKQEPELLLS